MLRKIKLYGPLAKFVGRDVLEADVASPAEAVRMLLANFSGLEAHIRKHSYRIFCGDAGLQAAEEALFPTSAPEIKIVPVVTGSGGGGGGGGFSFGMIIAGVALIALSAVTFGSSAAFAGAFSASGLFGSFAAGGSIALFTVGAGLVLTGVSTLLTPVPEMPKFGSRDGSYDPRDSKDPRNGFSFSGLQNVSRPGVPVPMVYGKTLVGSIVISAGVDVFHSSVAPAAPSSDALGTVFVFDATGKEL
jgi:predicted phage tail protein